MLFFVIFVESINCTLEEDMQNDIEIGGTDSDESSLNSEDKMHCAICLDQFKVNDLVSWSVNGNCDHVYHKDCIVNWLLKHNDCPYCRCSYVTLEEKEDCDAKRKRECLTFCSSRGLISNDCTSK